MIQRSKSKNGDQIKVTFALPQEHVYRPLAVLGDFNQWDPTLNAMKRRSNNTYSATVTLATGQRYAFRYRCEGKQWCKGKRVVQRQSIAIISATLRCTEAK